MKKYNILLATAVLLATLSSRADDISLGEVLVAGSGCPEGTARIEPDSNNKLRAVLSDFSVSVGAGSASVDHKNCSVAIPIHVPAGLTVQLVGAPITAHATLSRRATASISSDIFLAGDASQPVTQDLVGRIDEDVTVGDSSQVSSVSSCGADTILRMNVGITARSQSKKRTSVVSIAEIPLLLQNLQVLPCQ